MTGAWAGGEALLLASRLAVRDINANRDVLPGFELVMLPKDTAVRPHLLLQVLEMFLGDKSHLYRFCSSVILNQFPLKMFSLYITPYKPYGQPFEHVIILFNLLVISIFRRLR